jgi:nitroreductase
MNEIVDTGMAVAAATELIVGRRAVRAFLPTPVERQTVEAILEIARHAPSGSNTQPWKVYVATGQTQRRIIDKLCAAFNDPDAAGLHTEEYNYYPKTWQSPYIDRRRKNGWDLYTLLGIAKGDKERMHAQFRRNVEFFGAPVSLFFTIDRVMEQGSWLDYGMFIQNVMLTARAHGLATCPQAAVNPFHRILQEILQWPDNEMLVCGMSMGYEDRDAIESRFTTERAPVDSFTRFFD